MHIKTLYSWIAMKGLFSTRYTSDELAVESLVLLEGNEKRRKPSCLKVHFPLVAHGMSLLICFGLLCLSINVYNKSERKCIEKFNAYCKSSHRSTSHMDAYLPQLLFLTLWMKTTKRLGSSIRCGISPPTKALLHLRSIKRGRN